MDFIVRSSPILGGERVDRHITNAIIATVPAEFFKILRAGTMTGRSRKIAFLGPTSIAVHDDSQMRRNLEILFARIMCPFNALPSDAEQLRQEMTILLLRHVIHIIFLLIAQFVFREPLNRAEIKGATFSMRP